MQDDVSKVNERIAKANSLIQKTPSRLVDTAEGPSFFLH